jgi:uncharacterized protein YhbP (UPF0306 family)
MRQIDIEVRGTASSADAHQSLIRALNSTRVLAMGTVDSGGTPWINNAFFAFDEGFSLYLLSEPSSRHATNLSGGDGRVAVAVADTTQNGDDDEHGIQLSGSGYEASGTRLDDGLAAYRTRFPKFVSALASAQSFRDVGWSARLYVIDIDEFQLVDEVRWGPRTRIDGTIKELS